ncbi:MAG: hypothetical protein JW725_01205 [Candidatus Babeliaceae bacterium]|nr:hypothetical protein [Candidatus Babeliaceae bacterium]
MGRIFFWTGISILVCGLLNAVPVTLTWIEKNDPQFIIARDDFRRFYQLEMPKQKFASGFYQYRNVLWLMDLFSAPTSEFKMVKSALMSAKGMKDFVGAAQKASLKIPSREEAVQKRKTLVRKRVEKKEAKKRKKIKDPGRLSFLRINDHFSAVPINPVTVQRIKQFCTEKQCLPLDSEKLAGQVIDLAFYNKAKYLKLGSTETTRSNEQAKLFKEVSRLRKSYENGTRKESEARAVFALSAYDPVAFYKRLVSFKNSNNAVLGVQLSLAKGRQHETALVAQKIGGRVTYFFADADSGSFKFTDKLVMVASKNRLKKPGCEYYPSVYENYDIALRLVSWLCEASLSEIDDALVRAVVAQVIMWKRGRVTIERLRGAKLKVLDVTQEITREIEDRLQKYGLVTNKLYRTVYKQITAPEARDMVTRSLKKKKIPTATKTKILKSRQKLK